MLMSDLNFIGYVLLLCKDSTKRSGFHGDFKQDRTPEEHLPSFLEIVLL